MKDAPTKMLIDTILACMAGAAYSLAYVAPRPWYLLALLVSAVLVCLLRK